MDFLLSIIRDLPNTGLRMELAESATRSSGRSSVDVMTMLLIAFDSTTIHDTTFVYQHVLNAGLYDFE